MTDSVKTEKGTILPLMNLKGKPYMQVAHRIVWFNEAVKNYVLSTHFHKLDEKEAIITATVTIFDENGKMLKQAVGTKSENKASFADFIEKAETGAIGRAITTLGYGTAYALADLDEGTRIIDSPVVDTKATVAKNESAAAKLSEAKQAATAAVSAPTKISTFRKAKPKVEEAPASNGASEASDAGWT